MPAGELLTPTTVRSLLADHGLRPSRALGQHFLADPNTARRIVRLAGIESGDRVLEIGPGLGSLTLALADAGARVVALELDRHLAPVLEETVAASDTVRVEVGDALEVDFDGLLDDGPWHSVSNLPYNVAAPVVARLLDDFPRVEHLMVMVQREVGERLAAGPGDAAYGALSVKVAFHADARLVGTVPPTVFVPPPKVESALVRITRRSAPAVDVPSTDRLFALVRAGFAHRRKMLRRALQPVLGDRTTPMLTAAGIDPAARAETLSLTDWAALAHADAEAA
jgi:16S rRNA (adenine1518-N6/adenine1519-N6)-dimethyltransferase